MDDAIAEHWRSIAGYEGFYEVSDLGRVRSLIRQTIKGPSGGRVLRPAAGRYGHLHVNLSRENRVRTFAVHVLVAEAFIGPRPDGLEVCHGDGNAANNEVANLRWGTHSENELDKVGHGTHINARKTHCPQGHEYSLENTRVGPSGFRYCRACLRERDRLRVLK